MMNKKEIVELLMNKFDSVYCNTCNSQNSLENCDECHRKAMNWGISELCANSIAEKILK